MAETHDLDFDESPLQDPWNSRMTDDLSSGQHLDGLTSSQSKSETCSVVDSSPTIKQYGKSDLLYSTLNYAIMLNVNLILVGFHD